MQRQAINPHNPGYEPWIKRVQRVIQAYRENRLSKGELRALQRYILEFGHFNANFTLDELDGLAYPKSPTATMSAHAYLRSHQTLSAEILRHHFTADHKLEKAGNLYPLFIDSNALWNDAKQFCHLIHADDDFHKNINELTQSILTSTEMPQNDIWILLPTSVEAAKKNHLRANNRIRAIRKLHFIDQLVPENLRECFKTSKGREFPDEISQTLDQFLQAELAQIRAEEESKKPVETAYQDKTTKEKIKWIGPKFGRLNKYDREFMREHKLANQKDLLAFIEQADNFDLLMQAIDKIENNRIDHEEVAKKIAIRRALQYNQAIDKWLNHQIDQLKSNIYFIVPGLKYQQIDTMMLVGCDKAFTSDFTGPKQLINRLGYRTEPSKLVYALLNIYPKLFVDTNETKKFWDALLSVGLVEKLPDTEKQVIATLPKLTERKLTDKNTEKSRKQTIDKLIKVLQNTTCAEDHHIYKAVMMKMAERLTNRGTKKNDPVTQIIMSELGEQLFIFIRCIARHEDFIFAHAVRALQSVGELLKLDLATTSQALMPTPMSGTIKNTLLKAYPVQQVVVGPYAMRSYLRVIGGCMADNPEKPLKLVVTNQNYFESLLNLKNMRSSSIELKVANNLYADGFHADVVITELDPNSSTDKRLFQQNLKGLIDKLEDHYEHSDMRLTLVIDTTLNSVNHPEITAMLDRAKHLINCGALNIVIIQSLTKFSQCGLDQCNAGLSIVINNGRSWKKHNTHYQGIAANDSTDIVAQRYFNFFASLTTGREKRPLTNDYIERIVKSTNSLYTTLLRYAPDLGSAQDNLLKMVPTTEYHLCYVAFNTAGVLAAADPQSRLDAHELETFNTHLKDHLILPICREFKLPLTSRQSIGFALSSVGTALDSIRFTVGDESLPTIVRYASIISYLIQYLSQHPDLASLFKKDGDGKYSERIQDMQRAAKRFCHLSEQDRNSLLRVSATDGILYGPFIQHDERFYVSRAGNNVSVYHQNRIYPSDDLTIYQYDCVTPIMKMTNDQLDFIFNSTDYQITNVDPNFTRQFSAAPNNKQPRLVKQHVPLLKNRLKFDVLEFSDTGKRICQIRYDELVAKQRHVNVYQRAFSSGLYAIDIDHWGEKDPVNARFLNLCIVLYVKQRFHGDFKVRGIPGQDATMHQRFLFASHYNFDKLGGAFQEAVNMIEIHREALLNLLQQHQRSPVTHSRAYAFSRPAHPTLQAIPTDFFNGPTSHPNAPLIEAAFDILTISDRIEMLLDNKEHKGIFAQKPAPHLTVSQVTFFVAEKSSPPKSDGLTKEDDFVPLIDFTKHPK